MSDDMTEAKRYLGNARNIIERLSRFDLDEMAANPIRVQRLAAAALTELDAGRAALAARSTAPEKKSHG